MSDVGKAVGERIRLYRRMKQFTLLDLSEEVHKSKATLSKYENGDIAIDIETLFEIARVLGVNPKQLLDIPQENAPLAVSQPVSFFPQSKICLYFYDGRFNRICRNLLETGSDGIRPTATLYYDIPSFDRPDACRNLYSGTVDYFDTFTEFLLLSQSNRLERLTLCAANPFDRVSEVPGMLSGISRHPMLPVAIKCILSPTKLTENEELEDKLVLSQKDIRLIRSMNMFGVEPLD